MAFDSVDKIFNDMLKRYAKFFGQDPFGIQSRFSPLDTDEDTEDGEFAKEGKHRDGKRQPIEKSRKFGYEIISGSDMKEPIIRIYGDPSEFPELKARLESFIEQGFGSLLAKHGVPMLSGEEKILAPEPVQAEENGANEPFSETFKEKDGSTTVNVDLPGVKECDVKVSVNGKTLRVEAHGNSRHYEKTILLEKNAKAEDLQWRLNNGVLEIKVRKAER
nr:Hsp20/alpha crystallin family protein [Candidatus Sigynarchaeum springense]MDO8119126.1 Hsp20/alpha crystallin family protein [Candidatus Sigynarchaeota archaeon]